MEINVNKIIIQTLVPSKGTTYLVFYVSMSIVS